MATLEAALSGLRRIHRKEVIKVLHGAKARRL